ncbi:hypothetical protein GCM10023215_44500 [Pseudonocardia yuanmonensis]|uniref:Uncharacterized protein n=1 Tax=Pseudonocardia yuanmonensis TaxID=1095914 RepID=A0ABP8X903_9PSEU
MVEAVRASAADGQPSTLGLALGDVALDPVPLHAETSGPTWVVSASGSPAPVAALGTDSRTFTLCRA